MLNIIYDSTSLFQSSDLSHDPYFIQACFERLLKFQENLQGINLP